ncbi:MAG: peptidoglycan DD-metalloendopeptidase family protein [Thermoanaerobaculia bacterium]|nr:peptidoglycan DD-metalloendopeptidase family protein [Thermoanaerobaculia bacterium]
MLSLTTRLTASLLALVASTAAWAGAGTTTAAPVAPAIRFMTEVAAPSGAEVVGASLSASLDADAGLPWQAFSQRIAELREADRFEEALGLILEEREMTPAHSGLLHLWEGDVLADRGDFAGAGAAYERALAPEFELEFAAPGLPVGVAGHRLSARAALASDQPSRAAALLRAMVRLYPTYVHARYALAEANLYEAMAAGDLPTLSLGALLDNAICRTDAPCVVSSGRLVAEAGEGPTVEALNGAVVAELGVEDEALLEQAAAPSMDDAGEGMLACTPATTFSGWRQPVYATHFGYTFMEFPDSTGGFHPGTDANTGAGDDDCGALIKVVANGCVTDASSYPTTWGSAVISHLHHSRNFRSQYGHMSRVYYSVGAAVTKGATLGLMGKVPPTGGWTCHLHWEVREPDHADPDNADYYDSGSQSRVADFNQNPGPFASALPAHRAFGWFDEGAMTFTGTWTGVTGTGDEDDLRWAYTTTTSDRRNVAKKSFTLTANAPTRVSFMAFVPYKHNTSSRVPVRVLNSSGAVVLSTTIRQSGLLDAWISIGSVSLYPGTYRIEVATNTGETGKRVAVDDFLVLVE